MSSRRPLFRMLLRFCAFFIAFAFCLTACGTIGGQSELPSSVVGENVHSRPYYTSIEGSGKDRWLIMIYLNAEQAEEFGLASQAIYELVSASLGGELSVVVQTYGTEEWQGEFMSQLADRILITADGVKTSSSLSEGEAGSAEMLADFTQDCLLEFPNANRKALFFWGENQLSGRDIARALDGAELDFIAFNTQPQTSFEDAFFLRNTADYLIASAGTYAVSWNYSRLFSDLSKNTSFLSKDIARLLAEGVLGDDIFSYTGTTPSLYCVDLTQMERVYTHLDALLDEATGAIEAGNFSGIAFARAASAQDDTHVLALDFALNLGFSSSAGLIEALDECMVYSSAEDISLSLYLPINASADENFTDTLAYYAAGDLDYTSFLPAYLTAATCADGTGSDAKWFNSSLAVQYLQDSSDFSFPEQNVVLTLRDGQFLFLTNTVESAKIDSLRLLTLADTGQYHLLLGNDPIFLQDEDGNYIAAEGRDEWLCINDQPVCSYGYTGADNSEHYLVPCLLGQTPVTLLLSGGEVTTAILSMGVFSRTQQITTGSILSFSYPMYSYEGEYLGESSYGYKIAVADGLRVSYESVDIGDLLICCSLKDISGHTYQSPLVNLRTALMGS